jgi:hypothetical protein
MSRLAGFVGSRSLPASFTPFVSSLVSAFRARGFLVASGGAVGADQYALSVLVEQGESASGVIFSAWSSASGFPASVQSTVGRFLAAGGQVVWGSVSAGAPRQQVVSALLGRNQRLVSACEIKDIRAVEPLISTLEDEEWSVRLGAVKSLKKIQHAQAIKPLIACLNDENKHVRAWAVFALGGFVDARVTDAQALESMLESLKDLRGDGFFHMEDSEPDVVMHARGVIHDIYHAAAELLKKDPRAIDILIDALDDDEHFMRSWAAFKLGEIADPKVLEALKELRGDDPDESVVRTADEAIRKIEGKQE